MVDLTQREAERRSSAFRYRLSVPLIDQYRDQLSERHYQLLFGSASGFSMQRMSLQLGLPVGTVKSGLHRARSELARLINERI